MLIKKFFVIYNNEPWKKTLSHRYKLYNFRVLINKPYFQPGEPGTPGIDAAYCPCPQRTSYKYGETVEALEKPNDFKESEVYIPNEAESSLSDENYHVSSQTDLLRARYKKMRRNRHLLNKISRKKQFQEKKSMKKN